MPIQPAHQLLPLFEKHKCWRIAELAKTLGYAVISIRRFLKQIGYFRSYTHNGQWYTLQSEPLFNRDGLWSYEEIGFSRRGSLTETIRSLINKSPSGLSAGELGAKLHHPCDAVVSTMYQDEQLDRVREGRVFRYLSRQARINRRQRVVLENRQPVETSAPLSTQVAVWVLVEFIRQPQLSFEQLATQVQEHRRLAVSAESIGAFFEQQGLKKTADTPLRKP
jgi:hypothetical protein